MNIINPIDGTRPLNARVWQREPDEHYVEPEWCSLRLFQTETFAGEIYDPCCGFGTIVQSARKCGLTAYGSDLFDRGFEGAKSKIDFLTAEIEDVDNIVGNPPFDVAAAFAARALAVASGKVALIFPTARLNAAHWLREMPLAKVYLMTPRPSMPPGCVVRHGVGLHGEPQKVGSGKMDFCWLVFSKGRVGPPTLQWLRRDA